MRRGGRFTAGALLAAAAAAGGCAAPHGGFAPSRDVCVTALPAAFDAVHDKGSLVLIHRLRGPFHRAFPSPGPVPAGVICVFVFKGPYPPGSVQGTADGGRYALLAVTTNHPRVIRVRMLARLRSRI
jgi:hypothetical protein